MSRLVRLAAGATLAVAALTPAAPAHAIECDSLTGAVCSTYTTVCRRISSHDTLHALICYLR